MNKAQYITFLITMVTGGLAFSISVFAYMHQTFSTKDMVTAQDARITRIEERFAKSLENITIELKSINNKLNK